MEPIVQFHKKDAEPVLIIHCNELCVNSVTSPPASVIREGKYDMLKAIMAGI